MSRITTLSLTVMAFVVTASPAAAVTFGQLDSDNLFPNVGTILAVKPRFGLPDQQVPIAGGSGTLIHPRVVLTAGHVTDAIQRSLDSGRRTIDHFQVSFAPNGFEENSWLDVESVVTHPSFRPTLAGDIVDIGLVILKEPVDLPVATLAHEGFLDELKAADQLRVQGVPEQFLLAGYGSTLEFPPPESIPPDGLRRYVYSDFQALLPDWLLLNHAQIGGSSGYGDSGGPRFWVEPDGNQVLTAVVSWGDPKLVSTEHAARIDTTEALDFIHSVLAQVDGATGGEVPLKSITTVPEPTSLALVCCGLLQFTFGARTRQRAIAL
jgi:hypothetical protein